MPLGKRADREEKREALPVTVTKAPSAAPLLPPTKAAPAAPRPPAARAPISRKAPEPVVADSTSAASPYLTTLGALARELEAQARGRVDTAAMRLIRQRLTEWVEDVRSVGSAHDLAAAVEVLIQRLSAALALASDLATEAIAIAAELDKLAGGAAPAKASRSFWK